MHPKKGIKMASIEMIQKDASFLIFMLFVKYYTINMSTFVTIN